MLRFLLGLAVAALALPSGTASTAHAQGGDAAVTLFNNVRVFDGKSGTLSGPTNVLVRGSL